MRRGLVGVTPDNGAGGYSSNMFYVTVGEVETNTDAFGRDRVDLTAITRRHWCTSLDGPP